MGACAFSDSDITMMEDDLNILKVNYWFLSPKLKIFSIRGITHTHTNNVIGSIFFYFQSRDCMKFFSLQYTVKNLQFAQTVEPDNAKISQKLSWAQQQRQSGLPTIPSTIETELEINPFMRADLPEVQVLLFLLN